MGEAAGGHQFGLENRVQGNSSPRLSNELDLQKWQRWLNPIERVLGDGCRLDLDVEAVVRGQAFGQVEVERFEVEGLPRTHGSMYRGFAVRGLPPASPLDLPPTGRGMDRRRLDDPTFREARAAGRRW